MKFRMEKNQALSHEKWVRDFITPLLRPYRLANHGYLIGNRAILLSDYPFNKSGANLYGGTLLPNCSSRRPVLRFVMGTDFGVRLGVFSRRDKTVYPTNPEHCFRYWHPAT